MKRLNHILFNLSAVLIFLSGCAKDDLYSPESPGEEVIVSFSATMAEAMGLKSGDDVSYDGYRLVCAVFQNGKELERLRATETFVSGTATYSPRLVTGQTYSVVFWAMAEGAYDVESLENIRMNNLNAVQANDAFSACISHKAGGQTPEPVVLKRPLAKVSFGVSQNDWNREVNEGVTPERIDFSIEAYSGYDALNQSVTGGRAVLEFSSQVTGEALTVDGTSYRSLASCLVFTESDRSDIIYKVYGKRGAEEEMIITRTIDGVPVQRNFATNIVGNLFTE